MKRPSIAGGTPVWNEPNRCPFCGTTLADGGPAFIDHIDDSLECQTGFDQWRDRVADDIRGEWTG